MTPSCRREFFTVLQKINPAPTTELRYGNRYQLLVAVVLSAQSTDKGVNAATAALFRRIKTPTQMLALGEEGLIAYIKTIGLFRAKARHIIGLSRILMEHYNGKIPRTREALKALPGVGQKTANVVLNTVYGQHTIAVDTHVFRVANRTGLAPGKTVQSVEARLMRAIEDEFMKHAHHWLILLGRYTCKAQRPLCGQCPVRHCCAYPYKN